MIRVGFNKRGSILADERAESSIPTLLPINLRLYQKEAVEEMLKHSGFLLSAEQRTGKTFPATEVVRRRRPQSLLIICPKIAIETVWKPAIESLGDLVPEIHIENYEAVSTRTARRWWQRRPPEMVIADESHWIKNPNSKRSRAVRAIAQKASYRLALTGTPLEGGIEDAWAQFDFIDPEVFGSWSDFKARYLVMGGYMGHQIVGYRNREEFIQKFNSRTFRVLLEEVKEKPTVIRKVRIRFPLQESRQVYDAMRDQMVVELNAMDRIVAQLVITQAMKLHQITGGHIRQPAAGERLVRDHQVGTEKLVALTNLLARVDPPVVIFVRFLWELERIARMLEEMGHTVTRISGQDKFTGFETEYAVIQVKSGVAIDLSRAKIGIFYSFDYSYVTYEQSMFRIRSYYSDRVTYYFLLAEDTVDEDIYQSIVEKRSLSTVICDKYRKNL